MTISFAFLNWAKLFPYAALGQLSSGNLKISTMLIPVALLGVLGGVKMVKQLPEKLFFQTITWVLLLISIQLIWKGLDSYM